MRYCRKLNFYILIFLGLLLFDLSEVKAQVTPDIVTNDWKLTSAGQVKMLIINRLRMYSWGTDYPGLIDLEYPPGSGEEHISRLLMYAGGILPDGRKAITNSSEAWPSAAKWDSIWVVNKGDTVNIGGEFEGSSDIYWPNYTAVSDQDFVCRFNDYQAQLPSPTAEGQGHVPLGLEFIQTGYSWGSGPLSEVIVFTWHIIPKKQNIKDFYMLLSNESKIGDVSLNPEFGSPDDRTFFVKDLMLAGFEDDPEGFDGEAIGSLGLQWILPQDVNQDDLNLSYLWSGAYFGSSWGTNDAETYDYMMAAGRIFEDQQSFNGGASFQSIGPFNLNLGDTLRIQMAVVLGEGTKNMLKNAATVKELSKINFSVPSAPPNPKLRVETSSGTVKLSWDPIVGNNPENYKDPNRADKNPKPFEGYRLYKSTQGIDGPWILLAEYDLPNNEYGNNIGIEYEYTNSGLLNNFEYYYSLTAFSKEDRVLNWPSMESSIFTSAVTAIPGTAAPKNVGEVAVVPNPYRGDVRYRDYNPPWEKPPSGRVWMEQDRHIQFINLPNRCKINIYTVTGDHIETIDHYDSVRGYTDWNLTSSVGQAVASGLYIFTAQNLDTGDVQVGKFVILK